MTGSSGFVDPSGSGRQWYDLFSRGARDWLRHNDKVRAAVRDQLPELIAGSDLLPSADRTVQVPVRFLEHARLRLRTAEEAQGVGQGAGKPGDQLVPPDQTGGAKGAGGNEEGGFEFILELKIDDIVDWLWEELKLPNLKLKAGAVQFDEYTREGWSRRGVRSRLDRRRSLKEALKRRSVQSAGAPSFTNEDLRYRQLAMRRRPATEAVIYFAMDVSSSMTEQDRKLAKSFFFWVVQGLRRQYTHLEAVFVAHTVEAWEFPESAFFEVSGSGGTVASTAFRKILDIAGQRFDPGRFNTYVFYASDGANFHNDREAAEAALGELGKLANYVGYVETASGAQPSLQSETAILFEQLEAQTHAAGRHALSSPESVWEAIRGFFSRRAEVEV